LAKQHHAMSMPQNTTGAGIVGERIDNRASARERWSASLGMPVWPSSPRGPDPRYCVSDAQHLMGERPQIELTLYRSDFGISSGLWRWKRNGCDATATAHTAQALSMKVPSRSSRAACRSWAVRVHHDRSLPGDGVPEAVSLKRAETGCLPRRPGPLPHRHCEENNGSAPTSSRLPRCKPSITTNAPHRSSAS